MSQAACSWHEHRLGDHNLLTHFKRSLERAGLPQAYRFHDLRHTAASLLAANVIHPRVAMELLGHKQISTTLEIYSHLGTPEQQHAIATIEHLFGT